MASAIFSVFATARFEREYNALLKGHRDLPEHIRGSRGPTAEYGYKGSSGLPVRPPFRPNAQLRTRPAGLHAIRLEKARPFRAAQDRGMLSHEAAHATPEQFFAWR